VLIIKPSRVASASLPAGSVILPEKQRQMTGYYQPDHVLILQLQIIRN
jgi:hypothetical protein